MLVGISPLLSPELLAAIYRMGHGDEIVLADAHFPGHSVNAHALQPYWSGIADFPSPSRAFPSHPPHVLRADGLGIADLLEAILPLFALDAYVDSPVFMMDAVPGDAVDPAVEASYRAVIDEIWPDVPPIARVERFAFYEQASRAFAVVMTGETAKYGNIILKKGVTPVGER